MKIDPRFTQESGSAIFTGNELLVKGALETTGGVHLMTGYPGSPIAGFFDTLESIGELLNDRGVVAKIASNEALSAAMVNGAQMLNCRAITAFKNVGMHVASDALALGTLAGTHGGGGLIIVGDDPWSDSTQVPADSRFLAEHLRLPIMEPSSPQEVKDWIDHAFQIGRAGGIYIGYLMTVAMADGGGTVQCRPNEWPEINEKQKQHLSYERDIEPTLEQSVLLPPRSWQRENQMDSQFAKVKDEARRLGVNRIINRPQKDEVVPLGFVASGNGYSYLVHALSEMGLTGQIPILKLGMPYPVDDKLAIEFAKQCEQVVVVEERRSFVEKQLLEILNPLRQSGQIQTEVYGKRFPKPHEGIPATRGLNPSVVMERIIPLIKEHPGLPAEMTNGRLSQELARIKRTGEFDVQLPERTPTFCPGCPHRDSSSVLLELRKDLLDAEYMLQHHKRKPVDLVAHGDTGCYTMMMFEPNKPLMHNYSGMGLGGATGAGVDPFIENKQLVFMGDGTFYHSGQTSIAHSIYNGQDITYIILDNKTTAMTGHQTHAGLEEGLTGEPLNALDIERIIKGMVPKHLEKDVRIVRMNPEDRDRYRRMMEETLLADGTKIVIADKECAITYHRRKKREERAEIKEKGYLPKKTFMNVSTETCEFCLECTKQTGCPGLKIEDTDYGPKIQTDMSWCVNDGACQRINACPSFEEVTVQRKRGQRMGDEHIHLEDLPEPPRPVHADQETWRCYLAGVGGMGIGLCTAIMCTAGHEMGYHVQFLDKKGLAIRNGGVFSQLVFTRRDSGEDMADPVLRPRHGPGAQPRNPDRNPPTTPLIPYGKADLLLGVDMLEATRALDPKRQYRVASPEHTAAVVNTAKTPTVLTLMGEHDFQVSDLEDTLKRYTNADHYFGFNVGDLCERVLDTKLYANIMMLGMAFQKGYLPLTREAIEAAIGKVTRGQKDRNLRAFNIGRKIAVKPELFVVEYQKDVETARKCLRRKLNTIRAWYGGKKGQRLSRQFRVLMKQTFRATRGMRVDDELMRDVIIRAYDCLIWGGINYARRYCFRLVDVFHKDDANHDYAITRQVVWRLAQCMLIKDEVYVAAMLTSPEKYKRDRRRFNVNSANGDRIKYKHHNRPEFEIFGRKIQFEWKSRDWQLRIMARCRFLRRLMPSWHQRERAFRDWFEQIVDRIDVKGPRDYQRWLAIVSAPQQVTGFREIRYPKMERCRKEIEQYLATDPSEFELPHEREERERREKQGHVTLPILEGASA